MASADDLDWQESVYLAWRDARTGLGGNHRIGNEINRGTSNLWCGVYRDDGTTFRHNAEALPLERGGDDALAAGPQRLVQDGPRLRFLLEADGCVVDLELEDEPGSLAEASGSAFGEAGKIFANNQHAFCRARGTVALNGDVAEVDALAWRDHSWGVRRWDSFLCSRSFGGGDGSSLQFRYGSMVGANGAFVRRGSLLRDGEPLDVANAEMLVHLDDDSVRCPSAEIRYHLASGVTTHVRIDVTGGMVGATRERYGWESVGDLTVDGRAGGWGFLEVNNNPRNGRDAPVFALGDALVNGLHQG
jgi:hypothetical protein